MFTDTTDTTDTDTDTNTDINTDTASTPKRIIPRSNEKIVRLDVRFPKSLHDEIEVLAIANGAPIHHLSKKPTLTPTVLDLIRIGLGHYSPEALERIQVKPVSVNSVTDNHTELSALKGEVERLRGEMEQLRGEIVQPQPPTIDPNIEARVANLEAAQAGK